MKRYSDKKAEAYIDKKRREALRKAGISDEMLDQFERPPDPAIWMTPSYFNRTPFRELYRVLKENPEAYDYYVRTAWRFKTEADSDFQWMMFLVKKDKKFHDQLVRDQQKYRKDI